jgi:hypothetical protein
MRHGTQQAKLSLNKTTNQTLKIDCAPSNVNTEQQTMHKIDLVHIIPKQKE